MQFVPEARNFTAELALCSNAPEVRLYFSDFKLNRHETENSYILHKPLCLSNKPYTLLRAAGSRMRIFHPLCTKQHQTIEIKRGKMNQPPRHQFQPHLTYSKPEPCQDKSFLSAKTIQTSKPNGFTSISRFTYFSPGPEHRSVPDREVKPPPTKT